MKRKINVGMALTENYDKITLDYLEEEVEFSDEDDFKRQVDAKINKMTVLIKEQFKSLHMKEN